MAVLTRTNPTAVARGTMQELTKVQVFKTVLAGGNGLGAIGSDAVAAKVTDALGGMSHILQVKSDGTEVYMVADQHGIDINTVAQAIGTVLDTGTLGALSGGVQTLSDGDTVTTTVVTDLEAI